MVSVVDISFLFHFYPMSNCLCFVCDLFSSFSLMSLAALVGLGVIGVIPEIIAWRSSNLRVSPSLCLRAWIGARPLMKGSETHV